MGCAYLTRIERLNMKHKLIIIALNDAQLECSCDKWYMCRTGEMTKQETIEEHNKHIESEKKYWN